ncbi:acetate--CoA ligase family protein [Desulfosarcina widdelii]|nr:acetate--CoA ligase [Desulfosarcina widdelii]
MGDIKSIIEPKSIAVVGATNRTGSVGLAVFKNLLRAGYQGVLYPVNPTANSIQGVKAFGNLTDIPDDLDMAVIVVPPKAVPTVIEQAAQKQVKGCILITAGFKEIGGHGVQMEREIAALVKDRGIRLVGPNCLGIINTAESVRMNASFARIMPKPGNIAFISQSGALCTSVLDYAAGRDVGFSKFISFGNKADVNEIDFLSYLKNDPLTDVILMYLEDISDARAFIQIARTITMQCGKPILAVKSGRSVEGAKAATSHTGALAGSDAAYDAIFKQSGIERVEGINELFHYAQAFSKQPIPKGKRIAIITNAGGPGIIATDAAIRHGLQLAELSSETQDKLKYHLPETANIHNPVDVIGDATHERYEAAIRDTLLDEGVDGAIVILTPQAMTDIKETAMIVPRVARDVNKPILASFMGLVDVSEGAHFLEAHGIPNYPFPEAAARTMAAMARFGENLKLIGSAKREFRRLPADTQRAARIIAHKLGNTDKAYMPEHEMSEILQCYDFPLLKSHVVGNRSELEAVVAQTGFPLAMKIVSPDIVHKSDAGGVTLGINAIDQAQEAFDTIVANAKKYNPAADIQGVLVEEMAKDGVEVILGATRDPAFGPLCMFGLGGIFVEVLGDVNFRLAPMSEMSADNMIRSIKSHKVLNGWRGKPPADIAALKDCILRMSQMVTDHPEIQELDINPLIVYPEGQGCVVADGRLVLKSTIETKATAERHDGKRSAA